MVQKAASPPAFSHTCRICPHSAHVSSKTARNHSRSSPVGTQECEHYLSLSARFARAGMSKIWSMDQIWPPEPHHLASGAAHGAESLPQFPKPSAYSACPNLRLSGPVLQI